MWRYTLNRLVSSAVSFFAVSVIVFVLMHALPGGPFGNIQRGLSPVEKQNIARLYGLNKPLLDQYLSYMNGLLHLNLGVSWESPGEPMLQLIGTGLAISASVAVIGLGYGIMVGLLLGVLAVRYRWRWVDPLINVSATVLLTTPTFVIAIILISVFAVGLHWFPSGGWGGLPYMVLPAIAYGINPLGTVARYTRNALMDEIEKPYVRVAMSKGLTATSAAVKHALRNSAVPLITIVVPMIPGILTGSVFIEAIFNVPGLGGYFVSAIENRDYPLEMTLTLFVSVLMILAYLISDLFAAFVDPRIRLGKRAHGG